MTAKKTPIRNPWSGECDYACAFDDPARVADVAERLRRAQPEWQALGVAGRCRVMAAWRDQIKEKQQEIVAALAQDTGRTLLSNVECQGTISRIDRWLELAPKLLADQPASPQSKPPERASAVVPSVHYEHQLVPYALVGAISPWNFPLVLALIDAIPALLAGCAALVKPSEVTPRFVEPLRASIEAVPELDSVLALVTGDASTGEALADSVDALCFTGSVATGRKVAARMAGQLKPAFLELGGKDPAIVLDDADLDVAASAILRGGAGNAGQACQAIERIYVAESVGEEFTRRLAEGAGQIALNHPDRGRGAMGPFISAAQAETALRHLRDALQRGAVIHGDWSGPRQLATGDAAGEGGVWCGPVVLTGVSHEMLLMREESFAPLLPVMPFASDDEAVALANDSQYGLSAAVFSRDLARARRIAHQLQAGAVSINDASLTAFVDDMEKESFKSSGLGGSRMGERGLTRFLRRKALLFQSAPPVPLGAFDESQYKPGAA